MSFSTILFTEKGRALQAKAMSGATLNFTKIAMGSGSLGGENQITLTGLIEPKVSLDIIEIKRKSNYAIIKASFNNQDISTGFYWRELGLFAQDPDIGEILYCYGNAGTLAEYIPPQSSEVIEKVVSISAIVGDATNVTATIDESMVFVTKPELDAVSQKADQAFQSASNGKEAIKAAITGIDPEITIPTDATFAQLAEAIGKIQTGVDTEDATALAEQLLAGMTAYVKGEKIVGAMPNNGAVSKSLPINESYTIPAGYHNGSGKVTQSIPTKAAATITPGATNQVISAGQYLTGDITILGDPDLIAANIMNTANIFGIQGAAVAGKRWAQGTVTSSALGSDWTFIDSNGYTNSYPWVALSDITNNLSFSPSIIILVALGVSTGSLSMYKSDNFYNDFCFAMGGTYYKLNTTQVNARMICVRPNQTLTWYAFE